MRIDQENKIIDFESPAEMARVCMEKKWVLDSGLDTNGVTAKQVADGMTFGSDEAAAKAAEMLSMFDKEIETRGKTLTLDIGGAMPLIPAHLSGDPECFYSLDDCRDNMAPLSIIFDPSCSAAISAKAMKRRGTAVLALVMAMSAIRPISLELCCVLDVGEKHHRKNAKGLVSFCCIRAPINTTPLDLATAAWCLTESGLPRFFGYGAATAVFDSPLCWQSVAGVDMRDSRNPKTIEATLDLMGRSRDALLIPSASSLDPLTSDPESWVRSMFNHYAGAAA